MDTAPVTENPTPAAEPSAADPTIASKVKALPALLRARVVELQARAQDLQARAKDLPTEARTRALALVARVRVALDLPSRSEIAELTQRLDALDRRITELGGKELGATKPVAGLTAGIDADAAARAATVPEGTPDPEAKPSPPEHTRKEKRHHNAAKQTRR
jgi:hypothetical protein